MSHHGGHKMPVTKQIRLERRERAEAIAAESGYNKLSTKEKLERLHAFIAVPGNGEAKKQSEKLENRLSKEAEPKPVKEQAVKLEDKPIEAQLNRKGKPRKV